MKYSHRQAGFTLVELIIVVAISAVIGTVIMRLTRATDDAYRTNAGTTNMNFFTRRALDQIEGDLRRTNLAHLAINNANAQYDSVVFQLPLSTAAGVVTWGADGTAGNQVTYLVVNGQLLRRTMTAGGATVGMDQVLANNVDSNNATGKGFAMTANGTLITVSLRLFAQREGTIYTRSLTTEVSLRN
jgi:prepilin-type N-terminal cleavage/methylation domain-containing protein